MAGEGIASQKHRKSARGTPFASPEGQGEGHRGWGWEEGLVRGFPEVRPGVLSPEEDLREGAEATGVTTVEDLRGLQGVVIEWCWSSD